MTISSQLTYQQTPANGTTTQFSFPNKIFSAADLVVTLIDTLGNLYAFTASGVNTFTNTATGLSYTVYNIDIDTGCYITFTSAPTNLWTVDMRTSIAELQSTSIKNQSGFLPELHEEFFDKATRMLQDLARKTYTFGVHGNDIEDTPWPSVGTPAARANTNLGFGVTGQLQISQALASGTLSQSSIGLFLYPQSALETAAGVTPVNYYQPWGDVRRYGAAGDGVTDDTDAIQNALSCNQVIFFFNTGNPYIVSETLSVSNSQVLYGYGTITSFSPQIQAAAGMNAPIVEVTSDGILRGIAIMGTAGGATPNQHCVYIHGTNNATLEDVYLSGGYDLVHIDGTSFYTSIVNCLFYSCYNSQLYVTSTTAAGVDMIMRGCRFLQGGGNYIAYMTGLGSLIWSDIQISGASSQNGALVLDQPAADFGGAQFTNVVFENTPTNVGPAVKVIGASGNAWDQLRFVNCYFTGQAYPGLDVTYCNNLAATNCEFSSVSANGSFYSEAGANLDWVISDSHFDGTSTVAPVQCAASASTRGTLSNCYWGGTAPLLDYSNNPSGVGYLNIFGGESPSATLRFHVVSDATLPGVRLPNSAWFSYTPTFTPASGAFTTATAQGWYVRVNKTIHWYANLNITTVGTASGNINVGLPSTAQSGPPVFATGKEIAQSPYKPIFGFSASGGSSVVANCYDNTSLIQAGSNVLIGGTYNVA